MDVSSWKLKKVIQDEDILKIKSKIFNELLGYSRQALKLTSKSKHNKKK